MLLYQHPYYVDACGRPTEVLHCRAKMMVAQEDGTEREQECGLTIGGTDHNMRDDNIDVGNVGKELFKQTRLEDSSDLDYCGRPPSLERDEMYNSVRALDPISNRSTRIFMHICLLAGISAAGNPEKLRSLFNPNYGAPPPDIQQYFGEVS